jgi:hypothetical protein
MSGAELPPAFRPRYLEQWECGAIIPVSEGVEASCGEVATRWYGLSGHPRCEAHKDVSAGLNLMDEVCRARLVLGSTGRVR